MNLNQEFKKYTRKLCAHYRETLRRRRRVRSVTSNSQLVTIIYYTLKKFIVHAFYTVTSSCDGKRFSLKKKKEALSPFVPRSNLSIFLKGFRTTKPYTRTIIGQRYSQKKKRYESNFTHFQKVEKTDKLVLLHTRMAIVVFLIVLNRWNALVEIKTFNAHKMSQQWCRRLLQPTAVKILISGDYFTLFQKRRTLQQSAVAWFLFCVNHMTYNYRCTATAA